MSAAANYSRSLDLPRMVESNSLEEDDFVMIRNIEDTEGVSLKTGHLSEEISLATTFKGQRKEIRDKYKQQKEIEVLATIANTKNIDTIDIEIGTKHWNNWFVMRVALFLTISGFIAGYDIGVVSVLALYLYDDGISGIDSSRVKIYIFISIGSLGAAAGAFVSGNLMDRYGRKKIVLISDILYFIGGLLMVLAPVMNILIISRLMIGVATGITSLNVPIYISEVCPTEMRGRVIAIYTFLVVFGTFTANVIILLMPIDKSYDWRILEAICLIFVIA